MHLLCRSAPYPAHVRDLSFTLRGFAGLEEFRDGSNAVFALECRVPRRCIARQLLSSGTRLHPTLPTAAKCCCTKSDKPSCIKAASKPTACKDANPFASPCAQQEIQQICTSAYTDPSSMYRDFLSSEAIATSSGQNDSGLFELSFRDEVRRAPFEFTGAAASRWRIELPPRNNALDLDSVTDLIMQVNYTAREGGPALREVADRAAWRRLPGDGVRFFDVKSEFSTVFSQPTRGFGQRAPQQDLTLGNSEVVEPSTIVELF
ncbi:hypothetical protein CC80DRAFT_530507 [Byssothecium circinans]|uniref:Tc toxin complex TcA C-terminal TcB-binding domain-containing protein n=1 Tax=Byssothecium circinans TaxID=147558 RepID=A0A6A5UIC7_9PLEO|nr:hypothetical protein CC80DRAFT_530507 [Byssothecium circinans]